MPKDYLTMPLPEFAVWIRNLHTNLTGAMATKYSVGLGVLTILGLDADFVEYWAGAKPAVNDQSDTVNSFVEHAINGDLGEPTGTNPVVALPEDTPAAVAPGIKKRIREIVNGIKAKKSIYVVADGEFLGFEGEAGRSIRHRSSL